MSKEGRTKALVIVVLLIVVAGLTVAFASLSSVLNINGSAYLNAAKWGIKFESLSEPVKVGTATTTGTAKIEETKSAEITGINVGLSVPGDKVVYTVDLVNEGTINAKIDKIEKTELTEEQQRYLTFKVTDKDYNEISEGDILSKGETKRLIITIEFIKDLTKEDLPTSTSTISLSYKLNFVQTDEEKDTTSSEAQNELPSGYKKVEYIESTGTQYIDTEFIPSKDSKLEIELKFEGNFKTSDVAFFGVIEDESWFTMNFGGSSSQKNTLFCWCEARSKDSYKIYSLSINDEIRTNKNKIIFSSEKVTYADRSANMATKKFDNTDSLIIFGNKRNGEITAFNGYYMYLYSCKLYSGDILLRDLIPCLDSDNKPCMYDTISKKTFYNSGTGEFLYGDVID